MATPKTFSLDSLISNTVVVDGTAHELLTPEELSPMEHARLRVLWQRERVLTEKAEPLTPDEQIELEAVPAQVCRVILDAPDAVQGSLTTRQRMKVIRVFTELSNETRRARATETIAALTQAVDLMAPPKTGAISSPGSSAPTQAATP